MRARCKKIRDLLGDKRGAIFTIPEYQRGYKWEKKHWRDLWTDVNRIGEQVDQHYLGNNILLEKDTGQTYEIVDGQQRIVTISILAMAIRDVGDFEVDQDGGPGDVRMKDILEVNRGGNLETKVKLADEDAKQEFDKLWRGDVEEANGRVRNAYDYYVGEVSRLREDEIDELLSDICDYLKVVETKATD